MKQIFGIIFIYVLSFGVLSAQETTEIRSMIQHSYYPLLPKTDPKFKEEQKRNEGLGEVTKVRGDKILAQEIDFQDGRQKIYRVSKDQGQTWTTITQPKENIKTIYTGQPETDTPLLIIDLLTGFGLSRAANSSDKNYEEDQTQQISFYKASSYQLERGKFAKEFHEFLQNQENTEAKQREFLRSKKHQDDKDKLKSLNQDYEEWLHIRGMLKTLPPELLSDELMKLYKVEVSTSELIRQKEEVDEALIKLNSSDCKTQK